MKLPAVAGGAKQGPLLISIVVLPLIMMLAVLSYSWPAGRVAPRAVPIGVVSTSPASEQIALGLQQKDPGAFDVTLYGSDAAARSAIQNREVYGALEVTPGDLTTLTASAASSTVAQLINQVADNIAAQSAAHGKPLTVTNVDVVPASTGDPHGAVLSSALVPLTVVSVIFAAASAVFLRLRPAWRQILVLLALSALASFLSYVVTQCCLGAFPGEHLATWATLALTVFSVSVAVAGGIALIGPVAVGLGVALFVFVGIPFSGVTSAPEMLPKSVDVIGQLLPPGAGQSLLRNTAYFGGHGPVSHLLVLIGWVLFGILADIAGHHSFVGFAARRHRSAVRNAEQNRQLAAEAEAQVTAADSAAEEAAAGWAQATAHAPVHASEAPAQAVAPSHHAPTHAMHQAPAAVQAPVPTPGPYETAAPYYQDAGLAPAPGMPAAPPPYGAPVPPPYGGQVPPQYAAPAPNPYAPIPNPYAPPVPNPYAAPAPNPYQAQAPNPYQAPAPNPYGASAPPVAPPYARAVPPVPAPAPDPVQTPLPVRRPIPTGEREADDTQAMDGFTDQRF